MPAAHHLSSIIGLTTLLGLSAAHATDFVVTTTADEPYDGGTVLFETNDGDGLSIREAIGLANANTPANAVGVGAAAGFGDVDGDTISITPSLATTIDPFTRLFLIGSEIPITDDVVIDGGINGGGVITTSVLNGSNANRAFNIDTTAAPGDEAAVTIRNFIVANTTAGTENGGAILIGETADVTIENTIFTDATAADGGAIFLTSGSLTISGSNFTGGDATAEAGSGGAIFNNGILTISDTIFTENTALRAGGAIESSPDTITVLTDCVFTNNTVGEVVDDGITGNPGNGGAFHITGNGMATISGGEALRNIAAAEGGAFWNGSGTMAIIGTTIMDNSAAGDALDQGGGGIFNAGGTLTVINGATISANTALGTAGSGGGILNDGGTLAIIDASITDNVANRAGGGIESTAGTTTNLTSVALDGNTAGPTDTAAPGNGGGFHITGNGNATVTGGTANANIAGAEGGALWNGSGTMLVDGTIISENTAQGNDADNGGGGIFNAGGTVTVQNDTIVMDNTATGTSGSGGGILNDGGVLTVTSSEITGNTASRAGGGVESTAGSTTTFDTITLNENTAGPSPGNGGGFHITGAGDATITGGTANGNIATAEGGALWNGAGTMTISGITIDSNTAEGPDADNGGGGIYNLSGTVNISGTTTISNNAATGTAGSGGGILNQGTLVATDQLTLTGNVANRAGGGIEATTGTTTTLTDVVFTTNTAGPADTAAPGNGGAIHLTGEANATIIGGSATGNTAAREGGGFWNDAATMLITGTTFSGNTATGPAANDGGGALFNNGGDLTLTDATVSGNSATGDSGSGGGLLSIDGTITITGTTFTANAASRAGGAIEAIDGTVLIASSTFGGDTADLGNTTGPNPGNGGALHISGTANTTATFTTVQNNVAAQEGGGFWNQAGAIMTIGLASNFADNTANGPDLDDGGGAIFNNGGQVIIDGTIPPNVDAAELTITGNSAVGAAGSGGAILTVSGGTVSVTATSFIGNSASRAGGAIEDQSGLIDGVALTVTTCAFTQNFTGPAPGNGGAIHITGAGSANINDALFDGNTASAEGGALWNNTGSMFVGSSTLSNNIASGNDADQGGGGIFNQGGSVTVDSGTVITANIADGSAGSGGGVLANGGSLNVSNSTISQNVANRAGGGIEVVGLGTADDPTTANIVLTILQGNIAGPGDTAAPGNGGAHHTTGPASVFFDSCLVTENFAANQGGGLWNAGTGSMEVLSALITANTSPTGAGIYAQPGDLSGLTTVANSTVSSNNGAGIFVASPVSLFSTTVAANTGDGITTTADNLLSLINSILADNSGPDLAGFALIEATNSIVETGTATASNTSVLITGVDPLLSPLQDNGGLYLSHQPQAGSIANNAGTNEAQARITLFNDVRGVGFPRITGGVIDIGSVEGNAFTYADFVASFSGATLIEDRDPEDNPDGDSLSNALEYLFGTDPENGSDGSPIQVAANGDDVLLNYPIAPGIPSGIDSIETSVDLTGFALDDTLTRTVAIVDGQAIVSIPLPIEDGVPTKFARVRVTPDIPDTTGAATAVSAVE